MNTTKIGENGVFLGQKDINRSGRWGGGGGDH